MWGYRRRKFLCKCSTVAQHQPIYKSHGNHGREMKNSLHILFLKKLFIFILYKKYHPGILVLPYYWQRPIQLYEQTEMKNEKQFLYLQTHLLGIVTE